MLRVIWFVVELACIIGLVASLFYVDQMSESVKIAVPLGLGLLINDFLKNMIAGYKYIRIIPKLCVLTIQGKPLRISFSTLVRIKLENHYLLIRSKRIDQFQPVGGVIKFYDSSIKDRFNLQDDDGFAVQDSGELRQRFAPHSLWSIVKFLKWFNSQRGRELTPDREFREELIETEILPNEIFKYPRFSYLKRVIPSITYGPHFQVHELFLFEIFELVPTAEQHEHLKQLLETQKKDDITFMKAAVIERRGYNGKDEKRLGSQTQYIV